MAAVAAYAIGHASPAECDELGMTSAQRLARRRAAHSRQLSLEVDAVIVDGQNRSSRVEPAFAIVGADRRCTAVAAASVLAKVAQDRLMIELLHPATREFAFEQNKGYPSPHHRAALSRVGLHYDLHRASWSFAPSTIRWRRRGGRGHHGILTSTCSPLAILLALMAAGGNAWPRTPSVSNDLRVEQSSHDSSSTVSLIRGVFRRPVWFLGLGVMTLAFAVQALALSAGTLSSVQPVMVTEIVFLVVIIGTWFRGQLTWREWLGSFGTAIALGVFWC